MKNFKVKWLLLSIILSIASINTAWAWYVPGTISYGGTTRWNVQDNNMGGDNKITFWALPAGTYEFQLTNGSEWSGNSCIKEISGSDLSKGTNGDNATFTITKPKNITIEVVDEGKWKVKVTAATPCAYIKYSWNGADSWSWSAAMSHNGDGTCSCIGQYGGTKAFNWQFSSDEEHYNDGTSGVTLVGNPKKSDMCVFTYDQSDQSLEIRKCNTTASTSYIYFDNTETGWTNTYKYFVIGRPTDATNAYSKTYALSTITNTNLWYYASTDAWSDAGYYAAIGSDAAFGTGNWNCDNLATASKYTAAYTSQYNLENTKHNIITPSSSENGSSFTIESKGTTYSALNSLTVGYKYVVDGSDMASGGAPAQVTMNSYVFNAHNTVTGNTAQTISANASGTYSKSIPAAYRGKVVLTQSNLNDCYKFIGWYNGNTEKETGDSYTYYPNANTTISAKYESRWTLKGTFPNETEWAEEHLITHVGVNASSQDTGYVELTLPGNTSFNFKVVDRYTNNWHSCSGTTEGSEYNFTYVSSNKVAKDCSAHTGDEKNMVFNTAAPGTYRFAWNADAKKLTVTYPASYKVTYDGNDKTGGSVPTDNDYYAANGTVTVKGNSGSLAKTGYNTLAYWNSENDGSGTDYAISTGTFSITANTTLYAKWTQGVTLHDNNGAAHNGSTTATWNATGAFSITAPTRDHYSVEGYYAEAGCTNKVLTDEGAIAGTNVSDGSSVVFISGGKWAHAAATTLYAKWTEDPYTVTTCAGTGGSVDEESYTAYVATTTAISATPATGYKFLSWEVVSGDVTFDDEYSASTTINATSDAVIKANFVYRWSVAGSWLNYPETESWDADTYAMGAITQVSSDYVCSVAVTLDANTNYTFKVVDRAAAPYDYWGNNTTTYYMTYGNSSNWTFGNNSSNTAACGLTTAGYGTYTFTWNITQNKLSITYPTSYTVTFGYGIGGSAVTASGSSSGSITSGQYVTSGENVTFTQTPAAGYSFKGWYTTADGNTAVSGMSTSDYVLDDVTADKTVYAQYNTVPLTFDNNGGSGNSNWDVAANWDPECVPTIEHNVIIDKPVVVNITNAVAKSVKIYNKESTAHTGKLTIGAGKALVVAEDIKKTEDGSTKIATTADVLHIEAGDGLTGNGALVWGTSGTPGNAQVDFYTAALGVKGNTTSKNQYIGTPFSNDQQVLYQFYYSWVYKIEYSNGEPYWTPLASDAAMNEFEGYDLISAYNAATTYQMEGTLVSNGNVTLTTGTTPALYYGSSKTENVLANSWVAPIKINTMDATNNFSNVEGTIYIFNMGSETDGSGGIGGGAGNYSTYTIGSAGETVIPSMQSFSVYTTGSSPSLTLNYTNSVKTPVANGTMNSANRAPARNLADEMDLLKLNVASENGWGDELKFYIHEDFSTEFENGWDGHKMFGYPEAPQLYAVSNDGELAVACVPTAENNVIAFTPGSEDNEYTFSFTYDGDEEYYLKDTKLNIETLINTEATYTFTSEAEDSEMRFIIIKRAPAVATDAETVSGDRLAVSGVQKIMHNGQLYIIRDGEIYDATGTMVK